MKAAPQILCVPPDLASAVLDRVPELMARGLAVDPGTSRDALLNDLASGNVLMWLVLDGNAPLATLLTEIHDINGGTVSVYALAGHDLHSWIRGVVDRLTDFARKENCARIRWAGKPAWRRFVPDAEIIGRVNGHTIFERAA